MGNDDAYLERDGARIAYGRYADGVFLGHAHGLMSSRDRETRRGGFDPAAVAGRRLLRYDARGHGASSGRPIPEDYLFGHHADDLLALLDVTAAGDRVDFMGASMGTATLLWAAVKAPHRFRRLVLAVPPAAWEERIPQAAWYRQAADLVERQGEEALRRAMATAPVPAIFADSPRPDLPPAVTPQLLPAVLRGAADSDLPAAGDIAALRHPILVLAWHTDPVHPVSVARRLQGLLPNSTLHEAATVDDIATWPRLIEEFLS